MTRYLILPTFPILTECRPYETLFKFLPNGVRTLVEDAVHGYSFRERRASRYNGAPISGLLADVLHMHDDCFCALEEDYPKDPATQAKLTIQYLEEVAKIELAVPDVEAFVEQMLWELFQSKLVEFIPEASCWHGKDLVVMSRTF